MKLTDAEREALAYRLSGETGMSHRPAMEYVRDLAPDIEALIAARLAEQREAIAAAILALHPDAAIGSPVSWRVCQREVVKLVREYQPGEDT